MGLGKWISGALGWAVAGPIGGLLGYLLGSAFETGANSFGTHARTSGGYSSHNTARGYTAQEQANSFMVALLVLSSAVMKADGKVMRSELNYVREFIRRNFGEAALPQAMAILQELSSKEVNLQQVCAQIKFYMNPSQRLQLLHYLADIAQADQSVSESELQVIRTIGLYLGIPNADIESLLAMFGKSVESAYTVLEITSQATDDEVKRAYKRMAMKCHPDRVATLGEDVKRKAEEKFKAVAEAYETIKRERGM